jgi:hypothetical protein
MIDDPELSNGGCLLPEVVESSIDAVLVPCEEVFTREETPGISSSLTHFRAAEACTSVRKMNRAATSFRRRPQTSEKVLTWRRNEGSVLDFTSSACSMHVEVEFDREVKESSHDVEGPGLGGAAKSDGK